MKVGEMATPLSEDGHGQQRHGADEQQRQRGQRDDADRDQQLAVQRHAQVKRADDQADNEGADGIDADDEAGGIRLAELLGDGDSADFSGGEDRADEDQGEGDDLHRALPDRGAGAAVLPVAHIRFGGALQDEGRRPRARKRCSPAMPASGNSATLRPTESEAPAI